VLAQLAAAIRIYGALAVTGAPGQDQLTAELERYLDAAQDQQDQLSKLLSADPAVRPVGWPLRQDPWRRVELEIRCR